MEDGARLHIIRRAQFLRLSGRFFRSLFCKPDLYFLNLPLDEVWVVEMSENGNSKPDAHLLVWVVEMSENGNSKPDAHLFFLSESFAVLLAIKF